MNEESSQDLLISKHDGVATLTLNRPEKLNAVNAAIMEGMERAALDIRDDPTVRVVVITGAGRAFCAGADVVSRLAGSASAGKSEIVNPRGYAHIIRGFGKPIIAAVNGVAVGVGLSIAVLCDIRIASDKSSFGAAWIKRGLMPDAGATYLLPRLIGVDRAFELMLTGEIVDAREAERIGLVTRVVAHDELITAANTLAAKIASGPPIAIELLKKAVYQGLEENMSRQLDFERWGQALLKQTEDFHEGIRAFQEKRPADFRGK